MSRTAKGSGSIRQRPDGIWEARYTAGIDTKTGKQIQRSVYGKTQKAVREKLRKITVEIDEGTYQEPNRLTVAAWVDTWLSEFTRNVKPHTHVSYIATVENHIKPALGRKRLSELTPVHVQQFVNHLKSCKDGTATLNAKTIKNIHGVLHSALQAAVRVGYLKSNPASATVLPKRIKPQIVPLQDDEVGRFLEAIKGHPFQSIYLVDMFTGIRESELLGLKWDDVDFRRGTLTIQRQLQFLGRKHGGYCFTTPKNSKSRQIVPAKFVMEVLHQHKLHQLKLQFAAGPAWNNCDNLVFTNELGHHLKHDLIYRHLKRIFAQMGLPNLRFHDLRHPYVKPTTQIFKKSRQQATS